MSINVEGNPFPEFMEIVRHVRPTQCTLVSDAPDAATSDHGWDLDEEGARLNDVVSELHSCGSRVSLFMNADSDQWETAHALGADRVELYTQPYAEAFARNEYHDVLATYVRAANDTQSVEEDRFRDRVGFRDGRFVDDIAMVWFPTR